MSDLPTSLPPERLTVNVNRVDANDVDAIDDDGIDVDGNDVDGNDVEGNDVDVNDLAVPARVSRSAIEAVLMVVDEPVPEVALASALGLPVDSVLGHLHALAAEYDESNRGFTLRQIAGGWRIYSRPEYATVVEKFLLDGAQAKLTQAALETLAVIAYRQPVSRSRVSSVRGVNVDGVVRTLLSRGLIQEMTEEGENGATLYGTSAYFLERLGLRSLDELPALAPFLPEVDVLDELADLSKGGRP